MKRRITAIIALVQVAVGCQGSSDKAPPQPSHSAPPMAPSVAPATFELIAATTEDGLAEYTFTGSLIRRLSPTPASAPQLSPDRQAVYFLAAGKNELRRLDLPRGPESPGAETVVAVVPPGSGTGCAGPPSFDLAEHLVGDHGLAIDRSGNHACMVAANDEGSHPVEIAVRIDLKTGHVQSHTLAGCAADGSPYTAPLPTPWCTPAARRPQGEPTRGPFYIENGHLFHASSNGGATAIVQIGSVDDHLLRLSPSGRWLLFDDLISTGTRAHRSLFLLDTAKGGIYSLAPGSWRMPIAMGNYERLEDVETLSVVDGGRVRWLGIGELLSVDSFLIVPGLRTVEIGEIAN